MNPDTAIVITGPWEMCGGSKTLSNAFSNVKIDTKIRKTAFPNPDNISNRFSPYENPKSDVL